MTKILVVNSKNGAENIRLSRLATRKSNLIEDKEKWKVLAKNPCSELLPATDEKLKKFEDMGTTISNRIFSKRADYFKIDSINQVTGAMIAQMATLYLESHDLLQIEFCRDPSRQSIDEEVQVATLKHYIPDATVKKITNGTIILHEGDFTSSKKKNKEVQARSIDITVNRNQKEFYIFAKYAGVAGGGQSHQAGESQRFVKEAMKYIDKNNDGKYFIILMDGEEAERHIPEFNDMLKDYPNMISGNCEDVIDFVLSNS